MRWQVGLGPFVLFREKAGIIGPEPCWVLFDGPYMYLGGSLWDLAKDAWRDFRSDRALVG